LLGKPSVGATRVAAITAVAIILTVSYAFLVGFGSILPGQNTQGFIGNQGTQPGLAADSASTVTTVLHDTSTLTYTYTSSNSFTSSTVVETTTITYTTESTYTTTSSCTSPGRCITLYATSPTNITRDGRVTFTAITSIPQESDDAFTAFMDCGCRGGVAHGYFNNSVATFSVQFTLSGVHQIYVADGNEQTNSSTLVYSNSVPVNVS
jgi:hypothetical protein